MSFESFQLNLKLTNIGYNKVMALDGKPVSLKFISLGKGNAAGTAGYSVNFRDTKTALQHEVVRKQIDSSQKTSYIDNNGTPLARLDFAAIFNDNSSFDVWEMGFFDDVGDLIYIWSHPTDVFAPKRPNIHLAISVSQHLLFAEEASLVIVQDAGVPFELFLQPLKDDFNLQMQLMMSAYFAATGAATVTIMQQQLAIVDLQGDVTLLESTHSADVAALSALNAASERHSNDKIVFMSEKFETELAGTQEIHASTLAAIGSLSLSIIGLKQEQLNANA